LKPFTAHTDGKVLIPDEPVELDRGAVYQVRPGPMRARKRSRRNSLRALFLKYAGTAKGDYPTDLAENHDHYLHGRPKRR